MLSAAPPLRVLLLTLAMPLVLSLPSALITAECATAFPSDGGQAVWVELAFGPTLGGNNAFWLWLTNIVDAAVYPQMMTRYLPVSHAIARRVQLAVVAAVAFVSSLGYDWVGRSQAVIFALTITPCFLFIGFGLPRLQPDAWAQTGGETDWALLLSWALWLYSGFSLMGNLAAEVNSPRRTYVCALCVLLPLVTSLNLLSFLVSLSLDPEPSHYSAGYFTDLAEREGGAWLKVLFTVGANAALVGLYHSQTLAADTVLAGVYEQRRAAFAAAGGATKE